MKRRVRWARSAERDLEQIVDFLLSGSVPSAESTWLTVRSAAVRLEALTERGRIVPELANAGVLAYRELIVVRRYRLVYRAAPRSVLVVGIFDGRRDLSDIFIERFRAP